MIRSNPFIIGNGILTATPSYSDSVLAGPYLSIQNCIDLFPEELRSEGRKVGIKQMNGRIATYEWIEIEPNVWDLQPFNVSNAEQIINSGENYNNFQLMGDIVVLTNTNAQAILTGLDPVDYKQVTFVNNSDFDFRINSEDQNSLPENRVKLPTGMASIGIEGTCVFAYIESDNRWQIIDAFASRYRPEHRGLSETEVEVVLPGGISETRPITELIVFRDAQSTLMTKDELNTAYSNRPRGFQVICKQISRIYIKVDDNTSDWQFIITSENVL